MGNYFKELFKEDLEKAKLKGKTETVIEMLKDNLSLEKISQYTSLTVDQITAIGKQATLL